MSKDIDFSPNLVKPAKTGLPAVSKDIAAPPISAGVATMAAGGVLEVAPQPGARLILCYGGVLQLRAVGDAWFVPSKHGVWVPSGLAHELTAQTPLEVHRLEFDAHLADRTQLPHAPVVVGATPLLRGIAQRLAGHVSPPLTPPEVRRLIWVTFDEIKRLDRPDLHLPGGQDPRLARVMDHLVRTPQDRRGLSELAHMGGTSGRTLERLFLAETGLSFGAWRRRLRFMIALEHLGRGEKTGAIARRLGYATPSSFIAAFKAEFGTPPSTYRKW